MKTTKGGKVMNPTDAYRKQLRKLELKRNKKERKKVREVGILKKDPEAIREQIRKLEMMNEADGALDKTRCHKKRQLEDTLNLVLKKRKEYEEKMREKGEEPIMFSHLPAPRRRATAEEEQKAKHPKPEDSVYFHPTLNPTGAPPPGKPPMYKSSIGPRIPLSGTNTASSSEQEPQAGTSLPPPPPPVPLPSTAGEETSAKEESVIPLPVPVPPPPPAPPRPASSMPPLPPPPPPPPGPPPSGPPPKLGSRPPPPPPPRPAQLSAGSTSDMVGSLKPPGTDSEKATSEKAGSARGAQEWVASSLTSPPASLQHTSQPLSQEGMDDLDDEVRQDVTKQQRPPPPPPMRPPGLPPPPRVAQTMMRPPLGPPPQNHSPEVLPPGVSRLPPPPPPPGTRPPLPGPPLPPPRVPAAGLTHPGLPPRPHLGPPPPMTRNPLGPATLPPPPPPKVQDGVAQDEPSKAPKPSYVKSAAATVVKRPLAQHTPELTSMVPASVLVRRENIQKVKPKFAVAVNAAAASSAAKAAPMQSASKPQSIDDSYSAFLEDMKALGAFDGDAM